jgi:dUTP pyrophosphatase
MEGFMDISDQIKKLHEQVYKIEVEVLEGGKMPTKAHPTDAGFDVYATDDVVIRNGEVVKHPLNIRMKLPAGSWARIETKSGLGSKGMLVYAGVVDEAYRGVPHVIATNLIQGGELLIKKGQKIAQITMNPHSNSFYMEQVDSVDTSTERGEGGFGSSGK